jgi:hypothetical protein
MVAVYLKVNKILSYLQSQYFDKISPPLLLNSIYLRRREDPFLGRSGKPDRTGRGLKPSTL